jgi:hypothetical protein
MALHTGAAEERNGDYFGPPVNRIARLLSTGHGGQVLLSAIGGSTERQRRPGKMMQDPTPGSKADKGSAISIVCSCGGEPQKGSTSPQKENTAPQQKDVAPSQQKGVSRRHRRILAYRALSGLLHQQTHRQR